MKTTCTTMGNCRSQSAAVETGTGIKYLVPDTKPPKKKTNYTQYPGQKRPVNDPYVPQDSEFKKVDANTKVATKRFVNYGGGNALILVDDDSPAYNHEQNSVAEPQAQYVSGAFQMQVGEDLLRRIFYVQFFLI